ncbi:distal tail protein Dit [Streptococcus hyointestinalis]|nr:distal tail protein Dit [Streptococcus hyointestinalis]
MTAIYDIKSDIVVDDDLSINGQYIGQVIPHYKQLKLEGVGVLAQAVTTVEIPARRGVWLSNVRDESRSLKVTYAITYESLSQLSDALTALNKLLRQVDDEGLLTISTRDDNSYSYKGVLESTDNGTTDGGYYEGGFTLLIPDPYRKSEVQASNGRVTLSHAFEVLPKKIVARVTQNTTKLTVQTSRQTITFNGNYTAGKELSIEWLEDEVVCRYDGRSVLSELAHLSIPESFTVRNGEAVTGTNLAIQRVEWRDEKL